MLDMLDVKTVQLLNITFVMNVKKTATETLIRCLELYGEGGIIAKCTLTRDVSVGDFES